MTDSLQTSAIEQLQAKLPGLDWITDEAKIARLSQDFSWFSPILKRELQAKSADIAVRPRTEQEVQDLVGACASLGIPLVLRGGGTGNYGQLTPLAGGVIIELTGLNSLKWIRPGVARAQAGIRLGELEKQANASGQELRCMPSTFRSATLGGLFGGGFGGIGSINYGPLVSPGNVLGIRVMTIEPEPRILELRGPDALRLHHMWGTNGLVLEVELALAPACPWLETIVTFGSLKDALEFGDAVASAPGIVKRELAVFSASVCEYLPALSDHLPHGQHAALLVLAEAGEEAMLQMLYGYGGKTTYRRSAEEGRKSHRTLMEFTWNHTTLNALKVDPTLTYLQSSFTPGMHVEQTLEMDALLGEEVLMHSEFLRTPDGRMTCSGLQLVRYTTDERLNEIMDIYRRHGVRINNPHVCIVEDGKAGGALPAETLAVKRCFDPKGLLNPGKLRDWPVSRA